jgi:hypothetical protein
LAEILMRRHISGAWKSISEMMDEEHDSNTITYTRSKTASGS